MGSVVLVALAGASRTATAVSRFVQYAGPTEAQVVADPGTMDRIAALPGVAYSSLDAFMLAASRHVSGEVRVRLHGGRAVVTGRRGASSLYDAKLATYDTGDTPLRLRTPLGPRRA